MQQKARKMQQKTKKMQQKIIKQKLNVLVNDDVEQTFEKKEIFIVLIA